jgi:flagellar basal-body rod protein FlgF
MDNALYVGLSRQMTLRRELDIVANNIANANTAGFKVENLLLETAPTAPARTLDGPKPVKFVMDRGVARDFGQGPIQGTGGPLDLAIEGPGFFKISTPEGERYTRDGRFRLSEGGRVVNQAGQAVLDDSGGEIIVSPEKGELKIATDGSISQGSERVGKVGVVTFDALSALEKTGNNLMRNTSNQTPQTATSSQLRQGALEGSNVNSISQITQMMEVTRAYESMAKMMDSTADLSRRAIERMGRVQ